MFKMASVIAWVEMQAMEGAREERFYDTGRFLVGDVKKERGADFTRSREQLREIELTPTHPFKVLRPRFQLFLFKKPKMTKKM